MDRVQFWLDGERLLTVLIAAVTIQLKEKGVAALLDPTLGGDSQSGRMRESCVKQVKDKATCIWR